MSVCIVDIVEELNLAENLGLSKKKKKKGKI